MHYETPWGIAYNVMPLSGNEAVSDSDSLAEMARSIVGHAQDNTGD